MTNLDEQIICLQKGLILANDANENNEGMVYTFQANLMQYGYMLTDKAFGALIKCSAEEIQQSYDSIINYLIHIMGGKAQFQPMYKNFPREVMQMSDMQLFYNAICHYWSNGNWMPTSVEKARGVKFENVKYTMLELTDMNGFLNIFTKLVSINQSLMPQDLEVVKWFVESGYDLRYPKTIPFKENLCTLAGMGLDVPVWQTTDVLRIAVHMSGGDVSLPKVPQAMIKSYTPGYRKRYVGMTANPERDKFKFRHFNRKERKFLLGLLNKTTDGTESMVPKQERWFRLFEQLHPGDHKRKFPKAYRMFQELARGPRNVAKGRTPLVKKNWPKVKTWGSRLNDAILIRLDLPLALKILSERPGEFMRRIDWLLRTFTANHPTIIASFKTAVLGSSNKVLYELYGHMHRRRNPVTNRSIMIKGARKRTQLPDLPAINSQSVDKIQACIFNALQANFAKLPPLGKVYIDPELSKIPLPTNMRSLNLSLKPLVRGQRTPFDNPKAKVIRAYCHWIDKYGTLDLDLSTTFIGTNKVGHCSWNTPGLKCGNSCHSGDVRNHVGPNAEYIDVDINDAIGMGFQYVVMSVHNFNGGALSDIDCSFGVEERQYPQSNLHWHPASNTGAQLLQSAGENVLIAILDLVNREYIYLDLDEKGSPVATNNVTAMMQAVADYAKPPAFSVYRLLVMHADARGQEVLTPEEADTIYKYSDFANDYIKAGEMMGI